MREQRQVQRHSTLEYINSSDVDDGTDSEEEHSKMA